MADSRFDDYAQIRNMLGDPPGSVNQPRRLHEPVVQAAPPAISRHAALDSVCAR
jgi:hypothetical protein